MLWCVKMTHNIKAIMMMPLSPNRTAASFLYLSIPVFQQAGHLFNEISRQVRGMVWGFFKNDVQPNTPISTGLSIFEISNKALFKQTSNKFILVGIMEFAPIFVVSLVRNLSGS